MEPRPPKAFEDFVARYPGLGKAWEEIQEAGRAAGPLDERTCRLLKLAVALGAGQQGAVHAGVRKAVALGISREELEQVVALCAGTLGLPATVARFCWVRDVLDGGR